MSVTLYDVVYRVLPRVEAGRALADAEWRTLVRAAAVLLEGSPAAVPPECVADNVEHFLCLGRSERTLRIRVLLTLVEYLPLCSGQPTFSRQTGRRRRAFIESEWLHGRGLGGVCARVRLLVLMGNYGDPSAWPSIGFVPIAHRPRFAADAQRRTGRYSLPLSTSIEERVAGRERAASVTQYAHSASPSRPA